MPKRGEVWQVDFGITQKVRPALAISIPSGETDRALIGPVAYSPKQERKPSFEPITIRPSATAGELSIACPIS